MQIKILAYINMLFFPIRIIEVTYIGKSLGIISLQSYLALYDKSFVIFNPN